ncbi:hypothetical protein BDV95DRAFT_274003 [Massariosphaeria phaeospora]|uniref:C2H2-type domain-containing protein n=1 Tax=Massariosphaeria phaeospora TaxID=100035 RepID=A0A7C8MFN1_9PLEO|nr:hypothetical protein BDV95DRAFT_274003 [Massariosphaeria phaeospora]
MNNTTPPNARSSKSASPSPPPAMSLEELDAYFRTINVSADPPPYHSQPPPYQRHHRGAQEPASWNGNGSGNVEFSCKSASAHNCESPRTPSTVVHSPHVWYTVNNSAQFEGQGASMFSGTNHMATGGPGSGYPSFGPHAAVPLHMLPESPYAFPSKPGRPSPTAQQPPPDRWPASTTATTTAAGTPQHEVIGVILSNGTPRTDIYRCNDADCSGATFGRLQDLKRHHRHYHQTPRPEYWCPVYGCSRSVVGRQGAFVRKDKLADHVYNMHT